jgi:branched-subunit amino acid aminotransferase/4-amino-4-deoxychorismate lyase
MRTRIIGKIAGSRKSARRRLPVVERATPPLSCGLLPGTLREALLADPDANVVERVLYEADLQAAERICLGNSVRGLVDAVSLEEAPAYAKL